jgi:hypothetical protein
MGKSFEKDGSGLEVASNMGDGSLRCGLLRPYVIMRNEHAIDYL